MPKELRLPKFGFVLNLQQIIVFTLLASGVWVLGWISWLTWHDISVWSKDLGTIFFGSRTGENISLGIGMTLIHYLLIGMSLIAAALVLFLRNRILATKPQYTVYIKPQKVNATQSKNVNSTVQSPMKEENAAAREERFFSGCLHHFGYLSTRPKDSPIPQECIICQRLGDCMVATVYVKKMSEV